MTLKQWSAWLLAAGITTLIAVVSIDFEGGGTDMGTASISLANMTEAQKDSVVRAEISRAKAGGEIISLRSGRGKVHKGDGNKLLATIGSKRQHYLDPDDNVYRPIDLTVKEISALAKVNPLKKFDEYVDAGVYRATWLKDKPHDYTFYRDDSYVKFTFIGSLANIDVKNEFTVDGVKQTYVIKEPSEHNILQWLVETDGNLVLDGAGGFKVQTSDGGSAPMRIMPPVASDAAGNPVIVSASVIGDTLTYWVTVEMGQVYPIEVDPTTTVVDIDASTGRIWGVSEVSYATARSIGVTADAASAGIGQHKVSNLRYVIRSFFSFDTSSLEDEAVIDSVKFKAVISENNSIDVKIRI